MRGNEEVSIVVCDKEVARKESSTEIWPAFPIGRLFADKPTGVEAARGAVHHQPATANVVIGPVHPRTMNEMFIHPSTRLNIVAVTAPSGVNGAYSSVEFNRRCALDTVDYVRYDQSHRLPPEPRLGGTFATPFPFAESTRAKAVKTKAGRTFVRVRDGMHVGQVC